MGITQFVVLARCLLEEAGKASAKPIPYLTACRAQKDVGEGAMTPALVGSETPHMTGWESARINLSDKSGTGDWSGNNGQERRKNDAKAKMMEA